MTATASARAGWRDEYVIAAGLRLRVGRHGSGPPLLLITGIGAHLDMWAPFAAHAGERELVAFDPVSYTHLTLPTICSV